MRIIVAIACLLLAPCLHPDRSPSAVATLANAADKRPAKYPDKEWCNAHDWPKASKHTPQE
jgi:hypothetical protein